MTRKIIHFKLFQRYQKDKFLSQNLSMIPDLGARANALALAKDPKNPSLVKFYPWYSKQDFDTWQSAVKMAKNYRAKKISPYESLMKKKLGIVGSGPTANKDATGRVVLEEEWRLEGKPGSKLLFGDENWPGYRLGRLQGIPKEKTQHRKLKEVVFQKIPELRLAEQGQGGETFASLKEKKKGLTLEQREQVTGIRKLISETIKELGFIEKE